MAEPIATVPIKLPRPPNYLRTEDGISIPVQDVCERDLKAIGKAWTRQLLEHAQKRRETIPDPDPPNFDLALNDRVVLSEVGRERFRGASLKRRRAGTLIKEGFRGSGGVWDWTVKWDDLKTPENLFAGFLIRAGEEALEEITTRG